MAVLQENWKDLILPNLSAVERANGNKNRAIIVLEPLERGYGITLGNSLRRVLLSSIRGFAVTAVRIDGVLHEYSVIDGIREDVADIIMNIKSLILNKPTPTAATLKLKLDRKGPVYAKDIVLNNGVEILNPDMIICHVEDSKVNLNVEMTVEYGAGYCMAEVKEETSKEVSIIYVDAMFSPVRRVTYSVENARVGQQTDYDRLILDVETNGTVGPETAVGIAAKILQTQLGVFLELSSGSESGKTDQMGECDISTNSLESCLNRKIDEMELSVRSYNCLIGEGIRYIGDLVKRSEVDMLKLPNFGRKSLNELKENLKTLGLSFDMKISEDWAPLDDGVNTHKKRKMLNRSDYET
ncbi:MAG: DNA-directed RNA polymerase subunit alpha [Rickettsiales bacterium]|jgi:DNA-directed RNA polymerase subunit alpha|nr:DNA-directed RNA polymerase subunit alpha [Rickettsiales bacterium]